MRDKIVKAEESRVTARNKVLASQRGPAPTTISRMTAPNITRAIKIKASVESFSLVPKIRLHYQSPQSNDPDRQKACENDHPIFWRVSREQEAAVSRSAESIGPGHIEPQVAC